MSVYNNIDEAVRGVVSLAHPANDEVTPEGDNQRNEALLKADLSNIHGRQMRRIKYVPSDFQSLH
jgi:hypothetical protein